MNHPINRVKPALSSKPFLISAILVLAASTLWIGCGSGKSNSNAPVSKIADRAFVSNFSASALNIVDAKVDQLSTFSVGGVSGPTQMFESADKNTTIVYNSLPNTFSVVSNATEAVTASVSLGSAASSLAVTADASRAFAALPGGVCTNSAVVGAVAVVSLTNAALTNCIPVTGARTIVLSPNAATLLIFAQDSNVATFMDTTALKPTVVSDPGLILDRPVNAVFSSDDTSAYILSCGAECGGTLAKVSVWNVAANTLGLTQNVAAAHEGLLDSGNLYVAGSSPTVSAGNGQLTVLNASTLTNITLPNGIVNPVTIADGIHDKILLTSGQLFVGARSCSDTAHGCLSIFNTTTAAVKFSAISPNLGNDTSGGDDVTGMEPIPGRTVVYVCEGGEVQIYDTTTDALQKNQIDIVGQAVDVREVF